MRKNKMQRDKVILSLSILITFTTTIVFAARRIALYDYNYIANSVHRMSLGEIPYRDFDLVLPPVTFIPVYLTHHLIGISLNISILICAILTQVCALLAFYTIMKRILSNREYFNTQRFLQIGMIGAALINVISIYPNYIYDSVATALTLVTLACFLRFEASSEFRYLILTQTFALLTFFTKYNMGGSLILGIVVIRVLILIKSRKFETILLEASTFIGLFVVSILSISALGGSQFINQTVIAPSKFKGVTKIGQLAQYNYGPLILLTTLILIGIKYKKINNYLTTFTYYFINIFLFANLMKLFDAHFFSVGLEWLYPSASFTYPIMMLLALHRLIENRKINSSSFVLISVIPIYFFGTFLSQGWNGSSYSLNPLLIILIISINLTFEDNERTRLSKISMQMVFLLTLTSLMFVSNGTRLGYVQNNGARANSVNWTQIGTALSSRDVSQALEIRKRIAHVKNATSIVEFPAEDSLEQFSSSITPWGRCLQYTYICPTKSDQDILKDFDNFAPTLVIFKVVTQIDPGIEPIAGLLKPIVKSCFSFEYSNKNYELYKKRKGTQACVREKMKFVNE